jgi:hypothetical protein
MTATTGERHHRFIRLAVLAAGVGGAWVALSLTFGAASASADEHDSSGGLLGIVGSVVDSVGGTTQAVSDSVDTVLDATLEPVLAEPVIQTVVEEAVEVAPAPVGGVVDTVPDMVGSVGETADAVVDEVNAVVNGALNTGTGALDDVASSGPTRSIVTPVVGIVDEVTGSLPVVGSLLGEKPLGSIAAPFTDAVDVTLDSVVGTTPARDPAGPGILPELPGTSGVPTVPDPADPGSDVSGPALPRPPAVDPDRSVIRPPGEPSASTRASTLPTGAAVAAAASGSQPASDAPGGSLPGSAPGMPVGSAPAGSGTGSGSGGASTAGSDALLHGFSADASVSRSTASADDELPSSPVYATDSTPD